MYFPVGAPGASRPYKACTQGGLPLKRLMFLLMLCSLINGEQRLAVYRQGHAELTISTTDIDSIRFFHEESVPSGMSFIPAKDSSFWFGDPNLKSKSFVTPAQRVTLTEDFWIDTVEVTQSDYATLMENTYSAFTAPPPWSEKRGRGPRYPAYYLNWYDAVLYCNGRSKRDGYDTVYSYDSIVGTPGRGGVLKNVQINRSWPGYHLPSEAQWEYACEYGSDSSCWWKESYL